MIASGKINEAERMSKEYSDYKYLRRVKEASNKVDYAIQQEVFPPSVSISFSIGKEKEEGIQSQTKTVLEVFMSH